MFDLPRKFRWLPHEGKRHAVLSGLIPTDASDTLCGLPVVVPRVPLSKVEWCWPTCWACDRVWREAESIPVWQGLGTPA